MKTRKKGMAQRVGRTPEFMMHPPKEHLVEKASEPVLLSTNEVAVSEPLKEALVLAKESGLDSQVNLLWMWRMRNWLLQGLPLGLRRSQQNLLNQILKFCGENFFLSILRKISC